MQCTIKCAHRLHFLKSRREQSTTQSRIVATHFLKINKKKKKKEGMKREVLSNRSS